MRTWPLVLIGALILTAMLVAGLFRILWQRLHRAIEERFSADEIVRMSTTANFFGCRSEGYTQIRGNGALVLTRDELWFMLALPRKEIRIPLSTITEISEPRGFLGKTKGMRLLCVTFDTAEGEDAVAWALQRREEWMRDIERLRRGGS